MHLSPSLKNPRIAQTEVLKNCQCANFGLAVMNIRVSRIQKVAFRLRGNDRSHHLPNLTRYSWQGLWLRKVYFCSKKLAKVLV